MALPRLFSFRRCPYAMRARMALYQARVTLTLIEVELKNKPAAMLTLSPKGTVPVLALPTGEVLDESRDILFWALAQADHDGWLAPGPEYIEALIDECDQVFKPWLDRYKYHVGYPEHSPEYYRSQALRTLNAWDARLQASEFLLGPKPSAADVALFPFVRQFANVDRAWFDSQQDLQALRHWLSFWLEHPTFVAVMDKRLEFSFSEAP
ncbi:glutathione S-transferase [Aequoribacter fuscus]|nr:glutathione S-transferase [Aequoribacter fuscus]QHJ88288.1 glutathione S-transferase [Aequoribacter fuscus]